MIRQWKTHRGGFAGHRSFSATLDSAVYGGQASPTVEFESAIVAGDAETSVTTHDYTENTFGIAGGALFMYNQAPTRGTRAANLSLSFGATDKTNQFAFHCYSEDILANTDDERYGDSSHVMLRGIGEAGLEASAEYSGPLTDGIQVNWDDADSAANQTTALLLKAENVAVGTVTPTTQDTAVTVTPGFEADVIILISHNATLGAATAFCNMSIGFAVWDGAAVTQCCGAYFEGGGAAEGTPKAHVSTTRCGMQMSTGAAIAYRLEASNFTSTQFDITSRDGACNDVFGYIALSLGAKKAWTGVIDTPTSTGTGTSFTSTGVAPEFGMHVMSTVQTADANQTGATAGSFGLSAFNATTEASHSGSIEDAAGTTNTANMVKAVMSYLDNDDQTDTFEATILSGGGQFESEGWRPNVTNVIGAGTAMKWPTLMIGAEAAAVGGIPGSLALMGVGI